MPIHTGKDDQKHLVRLVKSITHRYAQSKAKKQGYAIELSQKLEGR